MSFGAFVRTCRLDSSSQQVLQAEVAVEACTLWAERNTQGKRRGILLLVDEVARLYASKPDSLLLRHLGSLLNNFSSSKLNVVCSTLDSLLLLRERTVSRREIIWADLPAIPQEVSERHLGIALKDAGILKEGEPLPPALRIAISDASGHPRTLEYLMNAVRERKAPPDDLRKLRYRVLSRMDNLSPSFAAVRAALCGHARRMDEPLPGDAVTTTFRQHIINGTFINTDATSYSAVPKLSMFRLLQFAQEDHVDPVHIRAADCIRRMAGAEVSGASAGRGPSLDRERFERFMAGWLELMALLRAGEPLTALDLFHASSLKEFAKGTPLLASFVLSSDVSRREETSKTFFRNAVTKGLLNDTSAGIVATFRQTNPAFDLLLTAPCSKPSQPNGYVALAVEAGVSSAGTSGEDTRLKNKLDIFNGIDGRGSFAKMQPAPEHIVYVYAAAGRWAKGAAAIRKQLLREGVLLLCRDQPRREEEEAGLHRASFPVFTMERALTPTLADRAFFLLQLREDEATRTSCK
jgi:hypothetical protein